MLDDDQDEAGVNDLDDSGEFDNPLAREEDHPNMWSQVTYSLSTSPSD